MPLGVDSSRSDKCPEVLYLGNAKDVDDNDLASLPSHVNIVKDGLLDFNRFIGLEAALLILGDEKSDEGDEDYIPLSAYKTDGIKASQRTREREFLEDAYGFAVGAQKLESGFARDGEWQTLFRNGAKHRMDDAHCFSPHQLSTIACEENVQWDIDLDRSQSSLKNPKPDLCFGFPIHSKEHQESSGFRYDSSLENFNVDTILQLAVKGLRCVPVSSSLKSNTEMKRDSKELQIQLLCFPWCIVQLKGTRTDMGSEEINDSALETSYKASAAATGALAIFETLARFADVKHDGQHIPPVITITSVGANTTVWLAYSDIIDDKYRDHKMIGIWNGCISKIWDAIQFCRILDNLFFWSQHILRPQLSQYIDNWRLRYTPELYELHFRLEKDLDTAELIHKIQHRLSPLNISPSSHLPELIEQAVILQEVMKPSLRTERPSARDSLDQNIQYGVKLSEKLPSDIASSSKKSESRESTATGDTLGQRSTPSKSSTTTDVTFVLASSDAPRTSEFASQFKSPRGPNADEKLREQPHFSYPYRFQTSDFEFDERPVFSHSLESTSVHLKRPTASEAVLSEKNYQSRGAITSLAPPNPFIAKSFQLSFYVKYWWRFMSDEAPLPRKMLEPEPHSKLLTELISNLSECKTERVERIEPPKRRKSGLQLAEIARPPSLRTKIPWKDGKCIVVKLPPVMAVSSSKRSL